MVLTLLLFVNRLPEGTREEKCDRNMRIFTSVFFSLLWLQLLAQGSFSLPFAPSSRDPFTGYNGSNIKRMTANKVVSYIYDVENSVDTGTVNYKYSDNGLTVSDDSGNLYAFYSDGKVKSQKIPIHNIDEKYTYTDDGKLLSIESPYSKTICYYTNTSMDSLVIWSYSDRLQTFFRYGKEIATYNQNGYKYAVYRFDTEQNVYRLEFESLYEFDDQDRLIKVLNAKDKSLSEERVYLRNKIIVYFGDHSLKSEYTYNEKGDLIEDSYFFWTANNYWFRRSTICYNYLYSDITSNDQIDLLNNFQISTLLNSVVIENAKYGERVNVYDVLGNLCYSGILNSDRYVINLPSNLLYIVRIGKKCVKLKL